MTETDEAGVAPSSRQNARGVPALNRGRSARHSPRKSVKLIGCAECVPIQEMISFVSRRKFFAERDIVALANKERVHPGIIVRQIHNMTGRYELLRRLQVKVREYIMPTATVDGWGHVAPVSTDAKRRRR